MALITSDCAPCRLIRAVLLAMDGDPATALEALQAAEGTLPPGIRMINRPELENPLEPGDIVSASVRRTLLSRIEAQIHNKGKNAGWSNDPAKTEAFGSLLTASAQALWEAQNSRPTDTALSKYLWSRMAAIKQYRTYAQWWCRKERKGEVERGADAGPEEVRAPHNMDCPPT